MRLPQDASQHRGLTAMDGAIVLIVVLLIVQMWLVTATLESFLDGHAEVALPGALVSCLLFVACFALYAFIARIDAQVRRPDR